jgi:imidazolonepropionase-like amidohydrolase
MKSLPICLSFLIAGTALCPGNVNIPAPDQREPILFSGATIHPASSAPFEGSLLAVKGKIAKLFKKGEALDVPEGTMVLKLEGRHLYPAMIAANTVIGLTEIQAVRATRDMIEPGPVNSNVRAQVAVNPDSELLPVARSNGVLFALSVPKTHGLIAGRSALMRMDGWTWEEMTAKASVGMHLSWPSVPDPETARSAKQKKSLEDSRKAGKKKLVMLTEVLEKSRAYDRAKTAGDPSLKTDLRLEALIPVVRGKMPFFVHAHRLPEIIAAVEFCVRQEVRMVLVGGADAWRAAPLLKKHDIPVIVSPVNALPARRWEDYDTAMRNPLVLQGAGVRFCIAGRGGTMDAPHERNLPYQAARAASFGLPKEEALKSVTLYPAEILGVGDRLGSLEVGKDATLIITTGDPLEITSMVNAAFISGRPLDLANKHTRLYEKYREKYRRLKKAAAGE